LGVSLNPHRLEVYLNLASRMKLTGVNQLWVWAKREEQIRGVIESTDGMYGDLQGIAGKGLYEIRSACDKSNLCPALA